MALNNETNDKMDIDPPAADSSTVTQQDAAAAAVAADVGQTQNSSPYSDERRHQSAPSNPSNESVQIPGPPNYPKSSNAANLDELLKLQQLKQIWRANASANIESAFSHFRFKSDDLAGHSEVVETGLKAFNGFKDYCLNPELVIAAPTQYVRGIDFMGDPKYDKEMLEIADRLMVNKVLQYGSLASKVAPRGKTITMKDILDYIEKYTAMSSDSIAKRRLDSFWDHIEKSMKESCLGLIESDTLSFQITCPMDNFLTKLDPRIIITYGFLEKGSSQVAMCRILGKEFTKWEKDPTGYSVITPVEVAKLLNADRNFSRRSTGTFSSGIDKFASKDELNSVTTKGQRNSKPENNSNGSNNNKLNTAGNRVVKKRRNRKKKKNGVNPNDIPLSKLNISSDQ
ncbi:uncharacterized protein J8A68_003587 [[Candida] subhashii]|uniref:Uncharacterized protein n=1 Tax=[Candida] subhashii TaxID=561895 RepID=A0A8J5QM07_9ASCO|nr:uncharacterized protein J8A68_003587 [[Candida] subhashii]KAG7662903.1 hypothetical protein J8A68_003587 [[Candida] subhashii]